MTQRNPRTAILKRGLINSALFCVIWGGWAYFANAGHGPAAALEAAKAQAAFTVVNAFVYSVLMEAVFFRVPGILWRNIATLLVPNAVLTAALTGVHWLAGTPALLATVLPQLLIIYALCLVYILVAGPRALAASRNTPA